CGFFPDGSFTFLLSQTGVVQVYLEVNHIAVYQGPYGATMTPLPSDLPTVTLSAAYNQAIATPVPATWTVTWFGSAEEIAAALNTVAPSVRSDAKVLVVPGTGKNGVRFGVIHP